MAGFLRLIHVGVLVCALLCLQACDGGGGGSKNNKDTASADNADMQSSAAEESTVSYPHIDGQWSGTFFTENWPFPGRRHVSATITQSGDAITIDTSLNGIGSFLTGRIDANGGIVLTDAATGETWTTHRQRATESFIEIADFRKELDNDAISFIQLSRA